MKILNLVLSFVVVILLNGCAPTTQTGYFSPNLYGGTKNHVCNYYKTTTENQLCFKGANREQAYFPETKIEILSSEVIKVGKIDWEYKIGNAKYIPEQYFVFENVNNPMDCSKQSIVSNCNYGDGILKLVTGDKEEAYRNSDPKKLAEYEKKLKIEEEKEKKKQAIIDAEREKVRAQEQKDQQLRIAKLETKYGFDCRNEKNQGISYYEACLESKNQKAARLESDKEQQKKLVSQLDNSSIGQTCRSFGYKQGTEKYADCMKDLYIQQQNANNSGTTNVIVNDSGSQALADEMKRQRQQQGYDELLKISDRLLNPPRAPAVNCSSYAIGGTVQTRCQ